MQTSVNNQAQDGVASTRANWNHRYQIETVRLLPGEYYVTNKPELITTLLGSCIAACIRNPKTNVGGMNHFMLPEPGDSSNSSSWGGIDGRATRYGSAAMEHLVNDILRSGGDRRDLEVKIFGGGRVLRQMTDIGERNIEFARTYLKREGLNIIASDVGDIYAREVHYFPNTGLARVRKLQKRSGDKVVVQEQRYERRLEAAPLAGDVELFDD